MLKSLGYWWVTGQNVPMSKRPNVKTSHSQNVPSQNVPKSKRPKVITSQVKTFQSQNVPSQNVPESKRPKSKRPKSKRPKVITSQVKTSQSQNVPSQNVPESKRPKSKRPQFVTNLIHMVCKLMEAYMIGWLVCVCWMTPGLSKDIQCHVWPHFS